MKKCGRHSYTALAGNDEYTAGTRQKKRRRAERVLRVLNFISMNSEVKNPPMILLLTFLNDSLNNKHIMKHYIHCLFSSGRARYVP
jgi:hypothetical protein